MFFKVDEDLVKIIKFTLDSFHVWSGLQANLFKVLCSFQVLMGKRKENFLTFSTMRKVKSFSNLEVSLCFKKLAMSAYKSLIDKIVGKISHWKSRYLSYARRLVLIITFCF